jgi:hypothetical protein
MDIPFIETARGQERLKCLVSFCTSNPQQGVKYQLWYLIIFMEEGLYEYPMNNILRTYSSCTLAVSIKGISMTFN